MPSFLCKYLNNVIRSFFFLFFFMLGPNWLCNKGDQDPISALHLRKFSFAFAFASDGEKLFICQITLVNVLFFFLFLPCSLRHGKLIKIVQNIILGAYEVTLLNFLSTNNTLLLLMHPNILSMFRSPCIRSTVSGMVGNIHQFRVLRYIYHAAVSINSNIT